MTLEFGVRLIYLILSLEKVKLVFILMCWSWVRGICFPLVCITWSWLSLWLNVSERCFKYQLTWTCLSFAVRIICATCSSSSSFLTPRTRGGLYFQRQVIQPWRQLASLSGAFRIHVLHALCLHRGTSKQSLSLLSKHFKGILHSNCSTLSSSADTVLVNSFLLS